jgi:hypothetical protein
VYKKGDKLDYADYREICLLNVVFAKVLYDRLLAYAKAVVQHYQARQATQRPMRQILEKSNKYNFIQGSIRQHNQK